jgi:hypothetical protein
MDLFARSLVTLSVGSVAFAICVGAIAALRSLLRPHNYRALHLSEDSLEYEDLSRRRHRIEWKDISGIRVVRAQAVFDDLSGPYMETLWRIESKDGQYLEIPGEWSNRFRLRHAFAARIAGFDESMAARGFSSRAAGVWICFKSRPRT